MTEVATQPLVIPNAPRRVTKTASRRAWAEQQVQMWWKSALVISVVALVVGAHASYTTLAERNLLQNGLRINALITEVRGVTRPNYAQPRDDSVPVKLRWVMPNGEEVKLATDLPPGPGYAKVGELLSICVDQSNPRNWVEQKSLLPWWRVLALPVIMMLPIALLLLAIALLQRMRVLRVWRNGKLSRAIVVDSKNVSTSPRSRLIRYTIVDSPDNRIFKLLIPVRAGVPRDGELFEVLALPETPGRAVAAKLYADSRT